MLQLDDTLISERKALEEEGRALEAEKPPINWLPLEVLADIFWTAVQLEDTDFALNQPFHATPVVISHVCQKWRDVALATPQLWSYLGFSTTRFYAAPLLAFLERAGSSPLTLFYRGVPDVETEEEQTTISGFFAFFEDHFSRIRSMSLHFRNPNAMQGLVDSFVPAPATKSIVLRNLDLAITGSRITSFDSFSFSLISALNSTWRAVFAPLTELRLIQIPPSAIHPDLLGALTVLELKYAYPVLKLSKLCGLLSCTPNLQELVLSHTTPRIDTKAEITNIVTLPNLKRFEWSYPSAELLHRVLASIQMPEVERFEIWFETSATKSPNQLANHETLNVLHYPHLRELTLITAAEEESGLDLRLFSFPAVEKIEIVNVGLPRPKSSPRSKSKAPATSSARKLPTIPRLESIFRDPRMPQLTDLTLSRFHLSSDYTRMEALLGYMPRVTSLSLESCSGVEILLKALQAVSAGTLLRGSTTSPKKQITSSSTNGTSNINPFATFTSRSSNQFRTTHHGGVKLCPRLDALSFWDCHDLDIDSLHAVVRTRNGILSADEWDRVDISGGGFRVQQPSGPHAEGIQGVQGAQTASAVHNRNVNDFQLDSLSPVSSSDSQTSPGPPPTTSPTPSAQSPPLASQGNRNTDEFELDNPQPFSSTSDQNQLLVNHAVVVANTEVLELASETAPLPDFNPVPVAERVIRPLRKPRRQGPNSVYPSHSGIPGAGVNPFIPPAASTSTNIMTSIIANQESISPANIAFVRLSRCKQILSEHAKLLREDGVLDVSWNPYQGEMDVTKTSRDCPQPFDNAAATRVSSNPNATATNVGTDTTNLLPANNTDTSTSLASSPDHGTTSPQS
ncbi:hypothetical protein BDN72DRAFT_838398 [Pluteus cervinus]|uniref:Uncharacterized protein n=1 Tax=Pluteus cervinus TaxID=181527 RepID=A0ACD3AYL8_9AGAR|nr:hypothetical protein BDN72DRAFT_838398 [Pluteus cervinus]